MSIFGRWRKTSGMRTATERIQIDDLAKAFLSELALRHRPEVSAFAYSDQRDGPATLMGTTAAVNIRAILGADIGSFVERQHWAKHIASFGIDSLRIRQVSDPEHALCMAIQALNLLGDAPELPEECFAPLDATEVVGLVAEHDWRSTHKALWGKTAPLLASGTVSDVWTTHLFAEIERRLHDGYGRIHFGLTRKTEAWRTISVLYHLGMIYDAARAPYPFPGEMVRLLMDLRWPEVRAKRMATYCTDADFAWLLTVLTRQEPSTYIDAMEAIDKIAEARSKEWNSNTPQLHEMSTHHLYCYLWSTARFQDLCRNRFIGRFILDTLNIPSLFRVKINRNQRFDAIE